MPWLIAVLLQGLLFLTKSFVGRVLVALGIGVTSYTGMSVTINWLKTQAISAFNGMGADTVSLLSYMQVGVAINIVFSAMLARFVINGITGDTFKQWAFK